MGMLRNYRRQPWKALDAILPILGVKYTAADRKRHDYAILKMHAEAGKPWAVEKYRKELDRKKGKKGKPEAVAQ